MRLPGISMFMVGLNVMVTATGINNNTFNNWNIDVYARLNIDLYQFL